MINVTKTYLPDKNKYKKYIDQIYENGWVTNNGLLVRELEKKLAIYLGVKNVVLVSSGTVALEIAYRALNLQGSVITTPFSFVATTSSLLTNGLNPIFSDIDKKTWNLDPELIEEKITSKTSAILATHVFGNICDIERIARIAKKHNLKVVYDGAHSFGVNYKGKSVTQYGDITTLSFHATKLFHTIEGGALIINDDTLVEKVRCLINFGIKNAEEIPELGTNAKMNEFEAAMGLCVLDDLGLIHEKRKVIFDRYFKELSDLVVFQEKSDHASVNYAYFPILLENEVQMKHMQMALNSQDIFPRRYFYPSLDTLNYIVPKQCCSISRDVASRILCLPIYVGLQKNDQIEIIKTLKKSMNMKI